MNTSYDETKRDEHGLRETVLHALRVLLTAIALTSTSCVNGPENTAATPPCQDNANCGAGQLCVASRCVAPSVSASIEGLSIEVTPPQLSPLRRTHFLEVDLSAPLVELVMPPAMEFDAELVDTETGDAPVAAHMAIFGAPRIPGKSTDVLLLLTGEAGRTVRFKLLDGSYTARFSPLDAELPSFDFAGFTVRQSDAVRKKRFELPLRDCRSSGAFCYRKLSGTVTERQLTAKTLPQVRIRAISLPHGLLSTEAHSDAQGRYTLRLPATADTEFELTATLPAEAQPAWSYREVVSVQESDRVKDIRMERTDLTRRGRAKIQVVGAGGDPVKDALVTLTATRAPGLASTAFELQGKTDAQGFVISTADGMNDAELGVPQSFYLVDVRPPPQSPHGKTTTELDLSSVVPDLVVHQQIIANSKVRAFGWLTSLQSQMGLATVEFQELQGSEATSTFVSVTSDSDGRYDVLLDPGRYLVTAKPARESGETSQSIGFWTIEVALGAEPMRVDLPFPPNRVIHGRVSAQDGGDVVRGAVVEFFLSRYTVPISLGEATTDNLGTFSVKVPFAE